MTTDQPAIIAYDGVGRWSCSECDHVHTGIEFDYICIGCACECVPVCEKYPSLTSDQIDTATISVDGGKPTDYDGFDTNVAGADFLVDIDFATAELDNINSQRREGEGPFTSVTIVARLHDGTTVEWATS